MCLFGLQLLTPPKDPCTCMVYSWALKLLYRNPFKAQVYTIKVQGSFGTLNYAEMDAAGAGKDQRGAL